MVKPILKAYYGKMFFEFLVHDEDWERDTVIILSGFPSSNKYDSEMRFLFDRGYNVFFPRYNGMYQSKGNFLEENVVLELEKFIEELKKGKAKSLWDNKICKFSVGKIIILGGSFSGAIACGLSAIAGGNERGISKIVLFSPVWDFKKHNELGDEQNLEELVPFVKRAYKNLYRIKFTNLADKMSGFKECSPEFYLERMKENKISLLVLHDPNDKTVSIKHTLDIAKRYPYLRSIKHSKGHGWNYELLEERWEDILSFIKS
jgi:pimeloyl-ACP methyl ester carboxylesterase